MTRVSAFDKASRLALLGLAILFVRMAQADTFEVNTTVDLPDDGGGVTTCHTSAGTCSLRAAIMKSNQLGGSNIIHVPDGIYLLTIPAHDSDGEDNGDLNITASVAITGQGAGRTIIDANQIDRALDVASGQFVGLSNVTVRHGLQNFGGGISNAGVLTIVHCVIEENLGIFGGGVAVSSSGALTVVDSMIRLNSGHISGGGMYLEGSATVRDSTIYDNGAEYGGGIDVTSFSTFLYVVDSTISGNFADANGGGIFTEGSAFLYNTSVVGNDADHDHDKNGGIGGGVYAGGPRFVVVNALIAGNTLGNTPIADNCNGALEAYGMNLLDEREGCTTTTSDSNLGFVSLSTIGPLQDNGGPTPTHALLANSEAIDSTIDSLGCVDETGAELTTEQRGGPRVAGARCDVGAFEFGAIVDNIFASGFE